MNNNDNSGILEENSGRTSYIVIGLESSCTKIVAQMIAMNLGIIEDVDKWDGNQYISNQLYYVRHRSFPHGSRDSYTSVEDILRFDYVIIVSRDFNCSLLSKSSSHQRNYEQAKIEHLKGSKLIKNILLYITRLNKPKIMIFSSETAVLFQEAYTIPFLLELGVKVPTHIEFLNVNLKHIKI